MNLPVHPSHLRLTGSKTQLRVLVSLPCNFSRVWCVYVGVVPGVCGGTGEVQCVV